MLFDPSYRLKIIVVGLGVQGNKRKLFAGDDFVAAVDPVNEQAQYKNITEVPLDCFDAALVCLPDKPKYQVIKYLLENQKHVLVEKPLWCEDMQQLVELQTLATKRGVVCYTAYNHRFEPHFVRMKNLLSSHKLGQVYSCRLFYGNGTARLVRDSLWRDEGLGVITDLLPHLMDISQHWFGDLGQSLEIISANCFENKAFDYAILMSRGSHLQLVLEMSLLSWRNHFSCDVLAEKGSAHIESLCKWGPSKFTYRERVLPSGRPREESTVLIQEDPTWAIEYQYFKDLIRQQMPTDLSRDINVLEQLQFFEDKKGVLA